MQIMIILCFYVGKVNNFLIFRFIWFCSSSFFVPFKKFEKEITKNSVNMIRPGLRLFSTQENIKDLAGTTQYFNLTQSNQNSKNF